MKTAVVFLTNTPHQNTIDFAREINKHFDTFIIADNNAYNANRTKDAVIQIKDEICVNNGYKGCNINGKETHIQKEVIAYDKFLYTFCEHLHYDFIWVFEDDVFIPSIDTIINLQKNYCQYDLVAANNFLKQDELPDWHWPYVFDKIHPPYYYSMVCAAGFSRVMLNCVKEYVAEHKRLFYQEVMFNTIANHNHLMVADPLELKSIVWQGHWGIDEFLLLPNNVFHPLKNIDEHPTLRQNIIEQKMAGYVPVNNLPPFINELL